jgi:TRAP-type C4-dicarboxylate transport system substrate-binding protein
MMRALVLLLAATAVADAQPTITIAYSAPDGTAWKRVEQSVVRSLARTMKHATVNRVDNSGFIDPDEYVGEMKKGAVDIAEVPAEGLEKIEPSIAVLDLPMMFASRGEADYVAYKMWPLFVTRFAKAGYFLAARSEMSEEYFFTKRAISSVADVRAAVFGLRTGDPLIADLMTQLAVAKTSTMILSEIGAGLRKGTIDAAYGTYLDARTWSWNDDAKQVLAMPIRYRVSAFVFALAVPTKVLPAEHKDAAAVAARSGLLLEASIQVDQERAKKAMKLAEDAPAAELTSAFGDAAQKVWTNEVGTLYSQQDLDLVLQYRQEYRDKHAP